MSRNLNRRIEVIFPIYNRNIKQEIFDLINLQLKDNTKARLIEEEQKNNYVNNRSTKKVQAQLATYHYLKNKNKERTHGKEYI